MRFTRRRRNREPLQAWIDGQSDLAALARAPEADGDKLVSLLAAAEGDRPSEMSPSDANRILESVRSRMELLPSTFSISPRIAALAAATFLAIAGLLALKTSAFRSAAPASTPQDVIVKTVRFETVSSGKHVRLEIVVYQTGGSHGR